MGLISGIGRLAARNAHVLVIEVPGNWQTRAAVERAVLMRGWRLAFSPADADVLAVCGGPGPQLREAVELVWHQMPGPRVRVEVRHRGEATTRLDEVHGRLLDTAHHRSDARDRPAAPDLLADTEIPYGFVVGTMARIKKAGVNKLGMVTNPEYMEGDASEGGGGGAGKGKGKKK